MRARDTNGAFEYTPRQTPALEQRFPQLAAGDFNTGMRLVHPDGHVSIGADAIYHIARNLPGWNRLAWLYRVPGFGVVARLIYAWIARNRYRLAKSCDAGECKIAPENRAPKTP